MNMRLLVCGPREYTDAVKLWGKLDELAPAIVIHGDCRGADRIAGAWARARGVEEQPCPALWDKQGVFAGHARNQYMVEHYAPTHVLYCRPPGPGTRHMVTLAYVRRIPVIILP